MKPIDSIADLDERTLALETRMRLSRMAISDVVRNSRVNAMRSVMSNTAKAGALGLGIKLLNQATSVGHINKPVTKGLMTTLLPLAVRMVKMYANRQSPIMSNQLVVKS